MDFTSGDWIRLPDMSQGRNDHSCGLAKGAEVVVAGGDNGDFDLASSEILNLETMEWRTGPDLPGSLAAAASVPYGDTFLVVGGYHINELDQIYQFDPENEAWIERTEKLETARFYQVAVPLPELPFICE